jgi:dienelactone hydrolase
MLTSLLLSLVAATAAPEPPSFWGELRPGPHAVGFLLEEGASAPGAAGSQPRPVLVSVWYPARSSSQSPAMTFGEYWTLAEDLRRRSSDGEATADDLHRTLSIGISGDPAALSREMTTRILETRMFARRGASPRADRSPIVLFTPRYGTTAAQSVLAEYLASHGFVVAAVRPKSETEKLPFEAPTHEEKLAELERQTDDLRGALRLVRSLAFAGRRAAVISWSYAGESAWQIAQSDAEVELLVSLDSNIARGWVYQSAERLEAIDRAPAAARLIELDRRTKELAALAHGNFNALEGMIPSLLGIDRVQRWSKSSPAAARGYETIARQVAAALRETFATAKRPAFTLLELKASDGALVTSEVYRPERRARLCFALFHQSGSSRGEYRTIGAELARRGYLAVASDIRWGNRDRWNDVVNDNAVRHGTPGALAAKDQERVRAIKAGESKDLDAAVDWLSANGCSAIVAWGASIQANGVLELAAHRPKAIAAVIAVSPGEYAKDEPERMQTIAARVTQPALVLWGKDETDLSKPIFDKLSGAKRFHSSTGRHGNPVFFEDALSWKALGDFLQLVEQRETSKPPS